MINPLRAIARFCQRRVGWRRIGLVLSVGIILAAAAVLHRMLNGIDIDDVVDAIVATRWQSVATAVAFVAAGYLTLTLYDLFALRTIGRTEIPYRIAALAGFTSYSVGHNLGASVLTGSAVRYRIYSSHGLDAIDVAKVCFVAGLTFWLGNAAVLGLGIAYEPEAASAIDQLPPELNRVIALCVLAALACYLAWVWNGTRVVGKGAFSVALPNGPLTLVQILIGIVDLGFCALAMYTLLPNEPAMPFVTLAVIFVSATLLGFASHSPGGLGVFDAAMLVALYHFDREDLLAALLLFRLLYYITPFALALLVLGVREVSLGVRRATSWVPPRKVRASAPIRTEIDRK